MQNNLQANSLNSVNKSFALVSKNFIVQEPLQKDSWLKLDLNELKCILLSGNKKLAKAKILFSNGYFFVKFGNQSKELKASDSNAIGAILKIELNSSFEKGLLALSKAPLQAILEAKKRYIVELYFNDSFYMRVKDII